MSHSTGIEASKDLLGVIAQLHENDQNMRLLKIGIDNEELVHMTSCKVQGNWRDDYDRLLVPLLDKDIPCFILYRLDTKNNLGYEWLFLSWSPEHAVVREKTIYAGTRAIVKSLFGGGKIIDELNGNLKDEVTMEGYNQHRQSKEAPPPLSMAEEELESVRREETNTAAAVDSKSKTLPGVSFPVGEEALDKLEELNNGNLNYVRLMINIEEETIELENHDSISVTGLSAKVPPDHARYHVYRFSHTHEGDLMHPIVFIYTMPGYGCPVKERMLYSMCKASVIESFKRDIGFEIEKQIEVGSGAELTEHFVYNEVHPKKNIIKQKFTKPKGPAGRGPRRVIKD